MRYNRFFIILLILAILLFPTGCGGTTQTNIGYRAAIIDQLYLREPNPIFITEATNLLKSIGFEVDIWQGNQITVDFYRRLPSMGYRFILMRIHSGTLVEIKNGQVTEMPNTYLFTAENYTSSRYVADQLTNKVSYAVMEENSPNVFAVNSEFIRDAKGTFNHTVVLAMGCESSRHTDLEQAFIIKGASVYIGWSDIVTLAHVDKVTLDLLKKFCTSGMSISQGISVTMASLGHDPYYNSYLKFFPDISGSKTIKELTKYGE
jgi:hypothetical protein